MRIISFLFLFVISASSSYAGHKTCAQLVAIILKSSEKLLPSTREDISKILSSKTDYTAHELANIYNRLKQDEEIFLNTYLNRSKRKRALFSEELLMLREQYKIMRLSDDEVQTFYSNELSRLYFFTEQAIREIRVEQVIRDLKLTKDDLPHARNAISHYYFLHTQKLYGYSLSEIGESFESFRELEVINSQFALTLTSFYKSFKKDEDLSSYESLDLEFPFSTWIKQFESNNFSHRLCCKFGNGCTLCPNNVGLRNKNKSDD